MYSRAPLFDGCWELLELSLQNTLQPERLCYTCQLPITHHQSIMSTSDYFVVKIDPVHETSSLNKKVTKIKQIPTSVLKIGNEVYRFKSMISHCGNLNSEEAHYIAWLKINKRWNSINDENISVHQNWPVNGWQDDKKSSAYLLFYSRL